MKRLDLKSFLSFGPFGLLLGASLFTTNSQAGIGLALNLGATYRMGYATDYVAYSGSYGFPSFGITGFAKSRKLSLRTYVDYAAYKIQADTPYAVPTTDNVITGITYAQFQVGKLFFGPGLGFGYSKSTYASDGLAALGASVGFEFSKLVIVDLRGFTDMDSPYKFKDWYLSLNLSFVAFDGND